MSGLVDELRTKFEMEGEPVEDVTMDGERVRIELPEDVTDREELREHVHDVVGGDDATGLNVTTESVGDESDVRTVITFRQTI